MEKLIELVREAGVVGAGGAGFPTHVKLNSSPRFIIANGAECEPLLKTDQLVMEEHARQIVSALDQIKDRLGIEQAYIALKGKYKESIVALKVAITELDSDVKLHLLDNYYPVGDEYMIVKEVIDEIVEPTAIPLSVDAVVINVATLKNVYLALEKQPVTDRYVTILGEVKNPKLVKVPIGTPINEIVELAGGPTVTDAVYIVGGFMMGQILTDETEKNNSFLKKTDGAVIVLDKNHYVPQKDSLSLSKIKLHAKSACIQCRYCTDLCPRFLLGHSLHPHKIMRAVANNRDAEVLKEAFLCCECGVCELYACPMELSPRKMNVEMKKKLSQAGKNYEYDGYPMETDPFRDGRKIPVERIIARSNIKQYKTEINFEEQNSLPQQVKILTSQHIGSPAEVIVEVGEEVKKGQKIAKIKEGQLGATIHASIDGVVADIDESGVIIKQR